MPSVTRRGFIRSTSLSIAAIGALGALPALANASPTDALGQPQTGPAPMPVMPLTGGAPFMPGQDPAGGPNFYRFGDAVLYSINISNAAGANADISFQFRFHTDIQSQTTFLYNTGPISSLTDPNWNLRQSYSVTRIQGG